MTRANNIFGRAGLKQILTGVSAGALLVSFCAPALATDEDTKAEIRLLKEQLRRLEKKLDAQAEAQKETQREVSTVVKSKGTGMAVGVPAALPVMKDPNAPLWPSALYYKNVAITPGGFFEFVGLHRDHYIGADVATPFGLIPFPNNPTAHQDEYRFSSRRSRFIVQTDADLDDITHARMYLATDFLSDPQTGNFSQSDSWALRWRELYFKLDRQDFGADYASHFSLGQMYTLASLNSKGTTPDTFLTPPVIDDQYMPGYTWARQVGLRWSQNLSKDFQVAFGAETSYTSWPGGSLPALAVNGTVAPVPLNGVSTTLPGAGGFYIPGAFQQLPVGGSLYYNATAISFSRVPDLITKAAWDPDVFGHSVHLEGGGMLRTFDERMWGGNHSVSGGGAFASVIVQVVPQWLDAQASGFSGRGISRYGASDQSIPDVTFNWNGSLIPIHERQVMVGLTAHLDKATDVYVFAGGEFAAPSWTDAKYPKGAPIVAPLALLGAPTVFAFGYGNPAFVNSGCNFEGATASSSPYGTFGSCVGQTKDTRQITTGMWHNFYDGPAGKVRVGVQYAYTIRDSFQGFGGAFKGTENMIFTSFRYYPFN
jgi:hypothetical protein